MIHKHPDLKWEQRLNGKKSMNYGAMVIKLGKMK